MEAAMVTGRAPNPAKARKAAERVSTAVIEGRRTG